MHGRLQMTSSPKRPKSVCAYSYFTHTQKNIIMMLIFKIIPHLPQYFQHLLMVLMKHKIQFGLVLFFFYIRIVKGLICLFNSGGFARITSVKYSQVAGDEKAEEAAAGL